MKRMKQRYHFALALIAGALLASCVSETILTGKEEIEAAGGKGLLSVAFSADQLIRTKADPGNGGEPNSGIDYEDETNTFLHFEEEDRVREIRVILYDAEGKARYVKDYDVATADQWVETDHPKYQTKAFEVDLRPYQVAVLVNYKNAWTYYAADRDEEATDLAYRTKEVGHDVTVLTDTPLDFSVNADAYNQKAKTFLMQTLTGVYDTPAWYVDQSLWKEKAYLFMSNADGLIDVETTQIKSSASAAESAPIKVNVERAIAKVAFFMDKELEMPAYLQPSGINHDELKGFWRVDTQNMKVYPIRKQTKTILGNPEAVGSMQENRYAEDPNLETPLEADFFHLPQDQDAEDPIYQDITLNGSNTAYLGNPLMIAKEIQTSGYIDPKNIPSNYAYLEYVAENTIADGKDYHTATTTHILLMLKLEAKFLDENDEEVSFAGYYTYNGKVYPPDWMEEWLTDGTLPEYYDMDGEEIASADLTALASYKAEIQAAFSGNTPGEYEGLRYYVGGVNYYRIPIRHFTDGQLNGKTYGKYGVVRNNTYVLTLEEITSPGRPTIPASATPLRSNNRPDSGFDTEAITVSSIVY